MSFSQYAVELCALLVDETYGELTSRIFTILLRRGRLPIKELSRHTRLTHRQLRHGLAVLVQQNLVYHYTEDTGLTHYEANHDAAYALVRSGKIMAAVESRYGTLAKDIVYNLLLLGHTKVVDLEKAFEPKQVEMSKENGKENSKDNTLPNRTTSGVTDGATNGANGHTEADIIPVGEIHGSLEQLLIAGVVEPVVESMFRSPLDRYSKLEKDILRGSYGEKQKGTKQKEEFAARIKEGLREMRSEGQDWQSKFKKRPLGEHANGTNGSSKRRRLSHGVTNGDHVYEDEGKRLDPDLVIRINHEKCKVILRNLQLVEYAKDRIGTTTSQVYGELLRQTEERIPRCQPELNVDDPFEKNELPAASTTEVADGLDKSVDAEFGIGKMSMSKHNADDMEGLEANGTNGIKKEANGVNPGSDEELDPFVDESASPAVRQPKVTFQDTKAFPSDHGADRSNRILQVRNHLHLLLNDDYHFIQKAGVRGLGEYSVNYPRLMTTIQEAELDQILLENFGQSGRRLAKMMRKLGKLEEKQLPNLALMKQKDVRTKLAEMQMAGIIDIQEVPRDGVNRNNNTRTIFLWYFDLERVSKILLERTYKAMSRLLQRLDVERRRAHAILEITERTDVQNQAPEKYLGADQLKELQNIRCREKNIIGQVSRLDELVGIFRDY
ncbi:RNA polymerase III subunit RPC82-domain-containing protein [Tricladium varicosporioides]|nr:RNA polymerase III subunit RPC82-domain-containing protein [Hymenoscyphus varicosporioides]